ncbi:MAG: glycosyltransferase family 2 protein [Gemmatimonadota bacterium]
MTGLAVTVVIAAHNEAADIPECIRSVAWADEVIVVENDSTDRTVALARELGATVMQHPFRTIGLQRNAAISAARNRWILVVDADERAGPELAQEVGSLLAGPDAGVSALRVPRRNFFLGREIRHGGWERDAPVRLFRSHLRYDDRPVHERVVTEGGVGRLSSPLIHYPYDSLDEYYEKLVRYARSGAERKYSEGSRAHWWDVTLRPLAFFLRMFVFRRGFLDGFHGLAVAALSATSVTAKYAFLWSLGRRATARQDVAGLRPGP